MTRQQQDRATAAWLQARGWRQTYDGTWRNSRFTDTAAIGSPVAHPNAGTHGDLTAAEAVQWQSRIDHQQAEAKRARDIQRADRGSDEEWMEAALEAIRATAERLVLFTTDQVMDRHPDLPEPREPRAWGPAMLRAAANGWIVSTDQMAPSHRKSSNCRRKRWWRSQIHDGKARRGSTMDLAEVVS